MSRLEDLRQRLRLKLDTVPTDADFRRWHRAGWPAVGIAAAIVASGALVTTSSGTTPFRVVGVAMVVVGCCLLGVGVALILGLQPPR